MKQTIKLILICVSVYTSLLYLNYNLPVFKQIFAHYFFEETKNFEAKPGNWGCMTVNAARTHSIYDRNEHLQLNGSRSSKFYTFTLNDKTYKTKTRSYLQENFGCNQIADKVFYFSEYPEWSIIDNSFPDGRYWHNFLISSITLLSILLVTVVFLIYIHLSYDKNKKIAIKETFLSPSKTHIIVLSLFIPLIIEVISAIFQLSEPVHSVANHINMTYSSTVKNAFLICCYTLTIYLPSVFLLSKYPLSALKRIILICLFIPFHFMLKSLLFLGVLSILI